jgi:hypothetical protein
LTCIAGIVSNGVVYIGGDSAGIAGDSLRHRKDEKVFLLENNLDKMAFGFTTSFRMGQLLRYGFKVPDQPRNMDDMEYLCTLFIDSIRNCFKNGGWLEKRNDMECGGTFLMGYRGKLYYIGSDFQVGETNNSFDAVGSGREVAIGALHVLSNMNSFTVEEKIIKSLEAAEQYNSAVAGPFKIVSTKKTKTTKRTKRKR